METKILPGDAARLIGRTIEVRKRRYKILFKAIKTPFVYENDFPYIDNESLYSDLRSLVKKKILASNYNQVFLRKDKKYWLTNYGKEVIKQARKVMFPTVLV